MRLTPRRNLRPCIYLVSLAGAATFWTLEAVMERGFITEHFSLAALLPTDPGVLWFRMLVSVIIVGFSISYQERSDNIRDLEQQLDSHPGGERQISKNLYFLMPHLPEKRTT